MQWYPVSHQDRADTGGFEMIMGRKRERETGVEKFRHAAFCRVRGFRIIGVCETLENKYHCNSDDFFIVPRPPFFFFLFRFALHMTHDTRRTASACLPSVRVSMKSKSIFSQITRASRLRTCDTTLNIIFLAPYSPINLFSFPCFRLFSLFSYDFNYEYDN